MDFLKNVTFLAKNVLLKIYAQYAVKTIIIYMVMKMGLVFMNHYLNMD